MQFPDVLTRKPRPLPAWAPGIVFALLIVVLASGLGVLIGALPLTEGFAQMNLRSTRPVWATVVESKVVRDEKGGQQGVVKVQWRDSRGGTYTETVKVAPGWAASSKFRKGTQKELFATKSMMGTRFVALRESLGDATRSGTNLFYLGAGIMALLVVAGIGNFIVVLRKRSLLRNGDPAMARITDAYWKRPSRTDERGKKPSQPSYVVRYEVTTQDGQRFTNKETFSASQLATIGHMSSGESVYVVHIGKRACIYGTTATRWPTLSSS
jgi:hypothetical protein